MGQFLTWAWERHAMQVPAVVGLVLCDAAVLHAITKLRKRAARTDEPTAPVPD